MVYLLQEHNYLRKEKILFAIIFVHTLNQTILQTGKICRPIFLPFFHGNISSIIIP